MLSYATQSQVFDLRKYPAGEDHSILKALPLLESDGLLIEAHCRNLGDLARLRVQEDILIRNGIRNAWFVPYFPCARQDRLETKLSGFELRFALDLVAPLRIVIADPHSDVAGQLPHFPQSAIYSCFEAALPEIKDAVVVIPDAGAAKKAYEWAVGDNRQIVQSLKVRDPKTGKLSGFKVIANKIDGGSHGPDSYSLGDLYQKNVVIVDDICDAGGTFLGLGEILKRDFGVAKMTLGITHGLFTKGTSTLKGMFDNIVTFVPSQEHTPNPDVIEIPFQTLYDNHYEEIL